MDIATTVLIIVICLCTEAFFSGSEIGVVSANKMKLRHDAANGSRGAKLALEMLDKPEWLLSTTLVGTNISVVTNTTVATGLVIQLLGEQYSWLAVVIVAPPIWIFGEIVSKSVFQQRADVITPRAIFVLKAASYLFYPILLVFTVLTRLLSRLLGDTERRNPFTPREEIVAMMGMAAVGSDIEPAEQSMIKRVFDFGETEASEIMVPLIDVVGINAGATCGEATRLAAETAHKRLTVYDERVDRIIGTVNTLDLLLEPANNPITPFVVEPIYIPGSHGIGDLLPIIREKSLGMAVVVDEFGGAEGIVTLEDIIEEVVGEIDDEYDVEEDPTMHLRKLGERDYLVGARVELQTVEEELGLEFPEGDYQTLAGFVLEIAKEIPTAGAVVTYKDIRMTIRQATAQAIQEIRVSW